MNKCDGCTMCCELFYIKELKKPAHVLCDFCDGNGCTIWGNHPDECKAFDCSYIQSNANIDIRPDKCGIIFEKLGDKIFHGTIRPNSGLTDTAKGQIQSFIDQGFSVFVKDGESYTKFLGRGHNKEEIESEFQSQVEMLNGSS